MDDMKALGDLSGSTNKKVEQISEALLDIDNDKRWQEIGIKAEKMGDKMKYSYKGVSEIGARTEQGALDALVRLSKKAPGVVGMMEKISKTTEGRLSNIEDQMEFAQLKMGTAFKPIIDKWIDFKLQAFTIIGDITEYIGPRMSPAMDGLKDVFGKVTAFLQPLTDSLKESLVGTVGIWSRHFERFGAVINNNMGGLKRIAEFIRDNLVQTIKVFAAIAIPVFEVVNIVVTKVLDFLIKQIVELVDAIQGMKVAFVSALNDIGGFFSSIGNQFLSFMEGIFPGFRKAFDDTKNWLYNSFIKPIADWFGTLFHFEMPDMKVPDGITEKADYDKIRKEHGIKPTKDSSGKSMEERANGVKGSGGSIKNFYITIQKQVEGGITIHTTNIREGVGQVRKLLGDALIDSVNDVNYQ
jgi:hypothetical protein